MLVYKYKDKKILENKKQSKRLLCLTWIDVRIRMIWMEEGSSSYSDGEIISNFITSRNNTKQSSQGITVFSSSGFTSTRVWIKTRFSFVDISLT